MEFSFLLGIVAGCVQVAAFVVYNRNMIKGSSTPNATTWSLWAFLTGLNAASYAAMTGDLAKYFLPIASAVATIFTFGYALMRGKFGKIDAWDRLVLVLGIVAGFVWWWRQSAEYANMLVVLAIAISFWPTYRGVWRDPTLERPAPWFLWTSAYVLFAVTVVLRWRGEYQDLLLPVSFALLHGVVGMLVMLRQSVPDTLKS